LSVSTVQRVLERMIQLDLVEKDEEKTCRLVDPLFADWLRRKTV
jgi:DNA-binding IclR family transcriptional regulator